MRASGRRLRRGVTRRALAVGAVLSSLAALAACTGDDAASPSTTASAVVTTTATPRPDDGVLRLGAFLPRTGPGAALGEPMIAAVASAVDAVNEAGGVLGSDVVLEIGDENSETGLDELLAQGVDAIVGPASSLVALSQLDEIVQGGAGVVACSPSATALLLDDYPDYRLFFRTVPSDSLQMAAIARRVGATGANSVALAYLDDPYGRGLSDRFISEANARNSYSITTTVPFGADEEDLGDQVAKLVSANPGVIVVLADADDGGRLLAALDTATVGDPPPVIVNDAIRGARQTIQTLSEGLQHSIRGIAPLARSLTIDGPAGFFSANAYDCVNLIVLAAVEAGSDSPARIQNYMAAVSAGGRVCTSFADCSNRLAEDLRVDYNGASGGVELSTTSGDLARGWFEVFAFRDGTDYLPDDEPSFLMP